METVNFIAEMTIKKRQNFKIEISSISKNDNKYLVIVFLDLYKLGELELTAHELAQVRDTLNKILE